MRRCFFVENVYTHVYVTTRMRGSLFSKMAIY